jgi:hypothetical protein
MGIETTQIAANGFIQSNTEQIRVYIASPFTKGNKMHNVNRQIDAGDALMDLGFACYIPLLNYWQQLRKPRCENDWLNHDLQWMRLCNATYRIKPIIRGKELPSFGADVEEKDCNRVGIPVFYTLKDLCHHYGKDKEYEKWAEENPDYIY